MTAEASSTSTPHVNPYARPSPAPQSMPPPPNHHAFQQLPPQRLDGSRVPFNYNTQQTPQHPQRGTMPFPRPQNGNDNQFGSAEHDDTLGDPNGGFFLRGKHPHALKLYVNRSLAHPKTSEERTKCENYLYSKIQPLILSGAVFNVQWLAEPLPHEKNYELTTFSNPAPHPPSQPSWTPQPPSQQQMQPNWAAQPPSQQQMQPGAAHPPQQQMQPNWTLQPPQMQPNWAPQPPSQQQMQPNLASQPPSQPPSQQQMQPGAAHPPQQQMQPNWTLQPPQMQPNWAPQPPSQQQMQPNLASQPPSQPPSQQQMQPAWPSQPPSQRPSQQQMQPAADPRQQQIQPAWPSQPPSQQQTQPAAAPFPQQQMQPNWAPQPPQMQPAWPSQQPPPPLQQLNPNDLPSAIQVIEDDRHIRTDDAFPTGWPTAEHPPLVSTDFIANDLGNSNPKFMRSSLYTVPATQDFIKQSQVPFCISTTPFAKLAVGEAEPPVIDLGELGPVRCCRCQAYMCPFMEFTDGGRKFRCPFCHANTSVEEMYFAHLDHTGRRTDIQYRPELSLGSYEFVATKLYCKNGIPPKQPAFIFFLDVSYNAFRSGLVDIFCKQLPQLLKNLPKDYNQQQSSMRVGFATYDQTLHFYNLSNSHRAEMIIANDVSDVFIPFVEGFLVNFHEAEEAIKFCLEQVRTCFAQTRITETILGPVIQAGMDALRSADCAGKIFIFNTSIPNFEAPGKLKNREDRQVLGSDKEKAQLEPDMDFYKQLGEDCIKIGCAVDLFLFPNSYLDIASISPICNISGGNIYKYQYFDAQRDGQRFLGDLQHGINRAVVFDVMMRVRTSTGIRPTGFYGHFYMQNTTDIEIGAIDADKNVMVEFKYDDKLDEKFPTYFQAATLFTSCGGQRRLRIHNISLPVTTDYSSLYRFADQDTIVSYLLKNAAKDIREKSPKEVKDELIQRGVQILATYREKCSEQSPHTQLVLPEVLKLLPLYLSCILRTDALFGGKEMTVDDRAWLLQFLPSMRIDLCMKYLYPQILPLTNLELTEDGTQIQMPPPARASHNFMSPNEVYFIENGIISFIWIGMEAPAEFIDDVFNAQTLQHLDTESHLLPERDNDRSRAVRKLISNINATRPLRLKLFIIKQQDNLESWMKKFLVEDQYAANSISYADFLCQIHRKIREHLS